MNDAVLLLEEQANGRRSSARLSARRVSSAAEFSRALSPGRGPKYWIARDASPLLSAVVGGGAQGGGNHFLVVLEAVPAPRLAVLDAVFGRVLVCDDGTCLLALDELAEVLASPERADLFIGGVVDETDGVAVLYRGNLEPLLVPLAWFVPSGEGTTPDFGDFGVDDFGQTVRFGAYEAAADAILYEHDSDFRRRARRRLRETERGFGASLRRLRLQKGVARGDFPGISAKQVARLERGETGKPRPVTLAALAARLGVRPEEIEEY